MEISIRDIIKALIKKWYIILTIVSLLVLIGTGIAVNNYTKPKYTASSSFLFLNDPPTNINLHVGNCRAFLLTPYIKNTVTEYINNKYKGNSGYEVTIEIVSATIAITVTAQDKELAEDVVEKYEELLTQNVYNPILVNAQDLRIRTLTPVKSYEEKPSMSSLLIQIALFGFIGLFISGIIILTPLYNKKNLENQQE